MLAHGFRRLHHNRVELANAQAMQSTRDCLDEIRRVDLSRVDRITRDPARVGLLLRALGRHVATEAPLATLTVDTAGVDGTDGDFARDTVRDYLTALEHIMIIEDQPACAPHLRSRSRIRSAAKRDFVDSLPAADALRRSLERVSIVRTQPRMCGITR